MVCLSRLEGGNLFQDRPRMVVAADTDGVDVNDVPTGLETERLQSGRENQARRASHVILACQANSHFTKGTFRLISSFSPLFVSFSKTLTH